LFPSRDEISSGHERSWKDRAIVAIRTRSRSEAIRPVMTQVNQVAPAFYRG
jgi:hypothetical protein